MTQNPEENDPSELTEKAKSGDLAAFGLLVRKYQTPVLAFLLARIDDPFEAEDLAQEVFLIAYRKLNEVDEARSIRPWLCGIAANLVRNHHRKRKVSPIGGSNDGIFDLLLAETESLDARWKDGSTFDALEECLARIGDKAREILKLRYEDGLPINEIGALVGIGHSTVTMRLHRVREQLRQCIEQRLGGK